MKSILIAGHDPYGLMDGLIAGVEKYTNYEYDFLNYDVHSGSFRYKCFGERIHNFFLKNFTSKNLKTIHLDKQITWAIEQLKAEYDAVAM